MAWNTKKCQNKAKVKQIGEKQIGHQKNEVWKNCVKQRELLFSFLGWGSHDEGTQKSRFAARFQRRARLKNRDDLVPSTQWFYTVNTHAASAKDSAVFFANANGLNILPRKFPWKPCVDSCQFFVCAC